MVLPPQSSSNYKVLIDTLVSKGLPQKILLEQGYGWLIDEEKTKAGVENTPEEKEK